MKLIVEESGTENKIISLRQIDDGVEVWIESDYMAKYNNDGTYIFHGETGGNKYRGRWKDE